MPVLGERGKIKVKLDTTSELAGEDAWVELHSVILASDLEILSDSDAETDPNYTYKFLACLVSDWNMTEANGEKSVISWENLKKLPIDDLQSLEKNSNYNKQLDKLKKNNSSSTLPVTENPEAPLSTT